MKTLTLPCGPADNGAGGSARVDALVCDIVGFVDPLTRAGEAATRHVLRRVRAHGLRVGVVHAGWSRSSRRLRAVLGPLDVVVAAGHDRRGEDGGVRPAFVDRLCRDLGVAPERCAVVGGRRELLAAATWLGARTVMVPTDATPLFDLRALPHIALDLETAVDVVLAGRAST